MSGYYEEFFVHEMKFTVEDYGEDGFAVFHEGALVEEVSDPARACAAAVNYYKFFRI